MSSLLHDVRGLKPLAAGPGIQRLVAAAVEAAGAPLSDQVAAVEQRTRERGQRWVRRSDTWRVAAGAEVQREPLERRREDVAEERELATAMLPDRTLLRPLLVVVPATASG